MGVDDGGSDETIDPHTFLINLVGIARKCNNPSDAGNFVSLIANLPVKAGHKRHAEINKYKAKEAKKRRTAGTKPVWQCDECGKKISNKANLKRHVLNVHKKEFTDTLNHPTVAKRRANAKISDSRDSADETSKESDDTHTVPGKKRATNATPRKPMKEKTSEATKKPSNPKNKCVFCTQEHINIYKHYKDHNIDYPEEILFNHGNVLVISERNTDNGNAVWFKNEREKAKNRYKDGTCKFCEQVEFNDTDLLEHHYKTFHEVNPNCLDAINHLFRAEKKAHLVNDDEKRTQSNSCKKRTANVTPKKRMDDKTSKATTKPCNPKNKCAFCTDEHVNIYKHYRDHNIDNPEEILFNHGNVLVISDRNTDNGNAVWFKNEREKAKNRYKDGTCKFCKEVELNDKDLLEHHYKTFHEVDPNCLEAINHLFRAETKAHLVADNEKNMKHVSDNSRKIPERKRTLNAIIIKKVDIKAQKTKHTEGSGLLMYVCKCGVATEKYDSAVAHAQRHLALDYTPITETCDKCHYTFEVSCFTEHSSHHQDGGISRDDFKVVVYDYTKLLSAHWSDMFKDLSQNHKGEITSSSIYKYTRSVKFNSNSNSGIPIYQCDMCQLCIDPTKVENHCTNYNTCVKNKRSGYNCSECGFTFVSEKVLRNHKEDHKTGTPRLVTFNNKDDNNFNKALQKVQYDQCSNEDDLNGTNEQEETVDKAKSPINVISDAKITQFCKQCNEHIVSTEYDAHSAVHENENKLKMIKIARQLNEEPFLQNVAGNNNTQDKCATAKDIQIEYQVPHEDGSDTNEGISNNKDGGGHIEIWGSDSDSCPSLVHSVAVVEAQIHVSQKTHENQDNDRPAASLYNVDNTNINDMSEGNHQTINAQDHASETPETLLENIQGASDSQTLSQISNENQSTQDLLLVLEGSGSIQKTSAHNENPNTQDHSDNELSQDMFIDDIIQIQPNLIDTSDTANKAHEQNTVKASQKMFTHDTEENPRNESGRIRPLESSRVVKDLEMSSRDILHKMLSGDDLLDLSQSLEEERRKSKREFDELNALIAKSLSSKD